MEVIDELDILDDQDAESYGIVEAKAGIEQLNIVINKLKTDYSYGYKSKEDQEDLLQKYQSNLNEYKNILEDKN